MKLYNFIAVCTLAVVACSAMAQGGGQGRRGGFGNMSDPLMLLNREDVQKDLAVTEDQKGKIDDLREKASTKRQDAMQAARDAAGGDRAEMMKAMGPIMEKLTAENWTSLATILTADQVKRLKEIRIQMQGASIVANDKEIQTALNITDEQKTKLKDLQDRQQKAQRELFQKMQSGEIDRTEMPNIMKKNSKIMEDEINKILTEEQKTKLKDMSGKHFERVDPSPGGGF